MIETATELTTSNRRSDAGLSTAPRAATAPPRHGHGVFGALRSVVDGVVTTVNVTVDAARGRHER